MTSWDWLTKFVIIGDPAVGKSSLLVRLTDDRFLINPETTIGVEFGSHIVEIEETGERIKCQCWDTAGSETFRSITRSYYRGAAGALLVYSITNRASFLHIGDWLRDIRQHAEENVSIIMVGNMCDLGDDDDEGEAAPGAPDEAEDGEDAAAVQKSQRRLQREVTREEAEDYARKEGILFVETSAKTGENVEEAFKKAARQIHANFRASQSEPSTRSGMMSGASRPGVIAASLNGELAPTRSCCAIT